jgi:hypothetical protein
VLRRLEPNPVILISPIGDVLAWTEGGRRLFGPIGMLDGTPPNLSRYVFTDARARAAFPDWDSVADRVAVQLRLDICPDTRPLIDELSRAVGPAFADRMTSPLVVPERHGLVRINHPTGGEIRLAYETLDPAVTEQQHLLIYLPADDAATATFDELIDPGRRQS